MQKIPVIVWADLDVGPLGLGSKLREEIGGEPVLRRSMRGVCRSVESGEQIVYCSAGQAGEVKSMLSGLAVEVVGISFEMPGWWAGLQASRKWAMDGWRGGILSSCAFDEDLLVHVVAEIGRQRNAYAIMSVSAHAAWVDPSLLDRQILHYEKHKEGVKVCFTQAPPGLAGLVLSMEVLNTLPQTAKIAGSILGYHPESPQMDLISHAPNMTLEPEIIHTGIRFICDTQRSLALGRRLAEQLDAETATATEIVRLAKREADAILTKYPQEIELEAVSGWNWNKGYRPSPEKARGPIDVDLVLQRVAELSEVSDDLLVHVGGFGESTRHPQLAALVENLPQAGAFGISMQTTGLFEPSIVQRVASLPIDILTFLVDVPQRELYIKNMGVDGLPKVLENLDAMMQAVLGLRKSTPLVIPVMIKTYETMELMKEFFDQWIGKAGWSIIEGFSDYAGQIPDLAVSSMAGPRRRACRQIFGRMTVLADGRVVICNQDFNGLQTAGSIRDQSLMEIWEGEVLAGLRAAHREERFGCNSLCEKCRQWHRG